MFYDDGSSIEIGSDGTSYATDYTGNAVSAVTPQGVVSYAADVREAQKLDAYVAAPNGDARPWYERVAEFGLTRAIDSHYMQASVNKGSQAATYAGANGLTYTNGQYSQGLSGNMLMLLVIGAVVLVVAMD